jgi:hypothetical protein
MNDSLKAKVIIFCKNSLYLSNSVHSNKAFTILKIKFNLVENIKGDINFFLF